jgi:hypothetical protein
MGSFGEEAGDAVKPKGCAHLVFVPANHRLVQNIFLLDDVELV